MKRKKHGQLCFFSLLCLAALSQSAQAGSLHCTKTEITGSVDAGGCSNWEDVSDVSQFQNAAGNYCFSCTSDGNVLICRTNGESVTGTLSIPLPHPLFGSVTDDGQGGCLLVSGEANKGTNTLTPTVFVSRYDAGGKLIGTFSDNGQDGLEGSFATRIPFDGGNCDISVSGDRAAILYARGMYNGHQSNHLLYLDTQTMTSAKNTEGAASFDSFYNSHSFAQRAVSCQDQFFFLSEGDAYPRTFSFMALNAGSGRSLRQDLFHFGSQKNALTRYDMWDVNNNYAHTGNLSVLPNGHLSFVASSAVTMGAEALNEKEQLFIQIFDPWKDLNTPEAYSTTGTRSGLAGGDGDIPATDYGVLWLTDYQTETLAVPQAVSDEQGNTIILYELNDQDDRFLGVYSAIVSPGGAILQAPKRIGQRAHLNPYETPVYKDGCVRWTSNLAFDEEDDQKLFIYAYRPFDDTDYDATAAIPIQNALIDPIEDEIYSGEAFEPDVRLTLDGKVLTEGWDYTLSYTDNVEPGTACVLISGQRNYTGTAQISFRIQKASQELYLASKEVSVRYAKLKKKKQTIKRGKILKIKNAKGSLSFKKKKGHKKILVDPKTGAITLKKGLKKGRYRIRVKITSAATSRCKKAGKTVDLFIRVK